MQTIDNRRAHKDIRSDIRNPSEYQTLSHPEHDYQLNARQAAVFEHAYNTRMQVENRGHLVGI